MSVQDGTFTTATQNLPRKPNYPFTDNASPDLYPVFYDRDMMVLPQNFSPTTATRTSATNLLTYSEQFDNAAWTKTQATISANTAANPNDGQVTADSLLEAATTNEHTISQAAIIAASAVTFSVCLKANSRNWARLKITDSAATIKTAFFDLVNGVVGTVSSGATATIVAVPNSVTGWYLCSLTFTSPASGSATALFQPSTDGSTVNYAGDAAKGLFCYGAGLVQAASFLGYLLTTATTPSHSVPNLEINEAQGGTDPFAFLSFEDVELRMELVVGHFNRRYSRIPAPQTFYPGSRYIQMPTPIDTLGDGSGLITGKFSQDSTIETTGGYTGATIFTNVNYSLYQGRAVTASIFGLATGGTFTITYGANTTGSLNWNDSAATIAAAINGLASVIADGITVTVINELAISGRLVLNPISFASTIPAGWPKLFTMTSSITGPSNTHTGASPSAAGVILQQIELASVLTVPGHALNAASILAAVWQQGGVTRIIIYDSGSWGVIDSNTIWVPNFASTNALGYVILVGDFAASYQPTTKLVRVKEVETFALPGVTAGITTPADMTASTGLQNPNDFITAIATLSGFQTYQSEGPAPWMGGLIYSVKEVQINMDDF